MKHIGSRKITSANSCKLEITINTWYTYVQSEILKVWRRLERRKWKKQGGIERLRHYPF